ncbi:MAG TPA: hypothetical protein IGS52_21605 [Oscillatoriaceae cyanobacterium M33_DOE_052]|nr:hypothetical protein [Oscillatoriaceae cyanobacterium M33_DOE_052]
MSVPPTAALPRIDRGFHQTDTPRDRQRNTPALSPGNYHNAENQPG